MRIRYYLILASLLFIFGCEVVEQPEEEKGAGILVVESVPDDADLFINNVNKGKTPLTLYNFDVGSYNIIIKKEGYEYYNSIVNIEAGKKREVRAYLELKEEVEEKQQEEEEKTDVAEEKEDVEEEILVEGVKEKGVINISDDLIKYYDFSEKYFGDKLKAGLDVFSRRYPTHFVFTRYNPVNIAIIEKNIDKVKKEDCKNILGSLGLLSSGKTLCVNTKEGYVAAIGGKWEETAESSLEWKMFD